MRDTRVRARPDLRARALVVGQRVVGVRKLVEDAALARLLHGDGDVARLLHPTGLGGEDDPCAVSSHGLAALQPRETHAVCR